MDRQGMPAAFYFMTREEKRLLKELQGAERRENRKIYPKASAARRVNRPRQRIDVRAIDEDNFDERPVVEFNRRGKRKHDAPGKETMVIAVKSGSCSV